MIEQKYIDWGPIEKTERLYLEISSLKACDYVFTISEEEQWLLNQFGIGAYYLPYYPEGKLYNELIEIRKIRERVNSFMNTFLILGSATNTPTFKGMKELVEFINKNKEKLDCRFIVAGFGSEVFNAYECDQVICLGTIKQDKLAELMCSINGAIINQGYSTGALTKIPEFLVAGVPIICDDGSARSFKRFDGVKSYQRLDELIQILNEQVAEIPQLPPRPLAAYNDFKYALLNNP